MGKDRCKSSLSWRQGRGWGWSQCCLWVNPGTGRHPGLHLSRSFMSGMTILAWDDAGHFVRSSVNSSEDDEHNRFLTALIENEG